ncbi:MAG TPA: XDD4 family exosortase-dependent surface protein [Verrucomicrobiae bacterium]|nr:XDD4 family exosortase-dependent surface protein [Verrucomicrobiae bacterium]
MQIVANSFLRFAAALAVCAVTARASAAITFSGSSAFGGTGISASATFSTDGKGDLIISLANTFTGDTPDQSHILTAVFFSGADSLTPVSAVAGAGSKEWNEGKQLSVDNGSVLGQQWEYLSGLSGAPDGATAGISSTGLGIFGNGNFAGKGDTLDGSPYGLLSAGYNGSTGDGLKTHGPYIQDSMTFKLSGFNGNLNTISDVVFQYGTTLGSEPSFSGSGSENGNPTIPEANFGLCAGFVSLLALGFSNLRSQKRRTPNSQR